MPFCANCGHQLTGSFCGRCGTPAAGPVPPPPPPPPSAAASTDLPENVACALTYGLGALTAVLFLMLEPYNRNPRIRFHAFQSLFASLAVFMIWFALLLVTVVLSIVPVLGQIAGGLALGVFALAVLALWILLMIKAYQGEYWKLPGIGDLAEKQTYSN